MKSAETTVISMMSAGIRCFLSGCFLILILSIGVFAEEGTSSFDIAAETPYDTHGKLSVTDSHLTDSFGDLFQLRGVSTMNLTQGSELVSKDTFQTLRDDWHINTVRLAVYPTGDGGYNTLDEAGRAACHELLINGVKAADELGLYVIIDWHTLSDGDPNLNRETAASFFHSISLSLKDYDNVLYEICSTPNAVSWDSVSSYALYVIDVIRANVPDSIIIVGTPDRSQNLEAAALAPIQRDNILYSLQFYAASNGMELREAAQIAIQAELPLIVTQFSLHDTYGGSEIDIEQGDFWLTFLEQQRIGYVLWNLSASTDNSCLLTPDCTSLSNWNDEDLSETALWYIDRLSDQEWLDSITPLVNSNRSVLWTLSNGSTAEVTEIPNWYGDPASCEYIVTLNNPTAADIANWRIRFTWEQEILSIPEFWSCDIGGSGNSRLVISKEYNSVISSGSYVSFGFVVTGSSSPNLTGLGIE